MSLVRDIYQIDVSPWLGCREPFSSVSHLIGSAVCAGLAYQFICLGGANWIRTLSLSVMTIGSALLLLMSGLYHLCWPGPLREIMLRIDVVGVFLLIAASMTPAHGILFTGWSRWCPLALIWMAAILGIAWRTFYWDTTHGSAATLVFLVFGWSSAITSIVLWRRFGWRFVRPAVLSGGAYTLGAIVLILHSPVLISGVIGPHEIWHVAVLTGIGLQWYFVSQFASGYVESSKPRLV